MKNGFIACILTLCCQSVLAAQPNLVVQIVIDQLRGDILNRYQDHFTSGGFNRLLKHSIEYRNASHDHANTVTCVGHASIATGTLPAFHGIIANKWYDNQSRRKTYCVYDPKFLLLSRPNHTNAGRSPKWLTTSTLSDEWRLANKGDVYAVSLKDRSAIMLAGHGGKAFWFDKQRAQVTSSTYYYAQLPDWVRRWNQQHPTKAYQWDLKHPRSYYFNHLAPRFDNRFPQFNHDFPHQTGKPDDKNFAKFFSMTPMADRLTSQFTQALLKEKKLGQHPNQTDYLAISFSGNDAIGHQFGPNSIECEDNLYQLDKEIARLLTAIDHHVGLDKTLIILTADHGVKDSLVDLKAHQIKTDHHQDDKKVSQRLFKILHDNWQLGQDAVTAIQLPYIYFNHQLIAAKKLNIDQLKRAVAAKLNGIKPIFRAVVMPFSRPVNDELDQLINAMSVPNRSGDIYLVPFPNHTLKPYEGERVMHGSPWQPDRSVPLIVFQGHWQHQIVYRPVSTMDIAPTLSLLLSLKKPTAALGRPLTEVLNTADASN